MAKKTKTTPLQALMQSSGFAAAAIVLLFVSVGAVMVPGIFANAATPSISNVSATPGNGPGYGIRVSWDGTTRANWKGQTLKGGKVIANWDSDTKRYSASGLQCGVLHTFKVAAAGPGGGAQSSWKSASVTTRCPGAQITRIGTVGNRVDIAWRDTAGFSQSYGVQIATNGGGFGYAGTTSATSYSYNGQCSTSYNVRIIASANGQSGPPTAVQSIKTPACPPPSGGGSTGGSTGGGTSGGGSTGGSSSGGGGSSTSTSSGGSSGTRRSSSGGTAAPSSNATSTALGNPANLSADVASHKIVVLSWDAAANAEKYIISRSTDGTTWQEIGNTALTSYDDEGADFSTTYYYQLQAIGANGQKSELIRTQVTTDAFERSSGTITSQDKLVTVKIPDGAIEGSYSCTITATEEESDNEGSTELSTLLGPYDLLCVTEEGDVVSDFEKAVKFTMKLSSVSNGYQNISVQAIKNGEWTAVKGVYDAQKQEISFDLTSATSFAAVGEKQKSIWGTVFTVLMILILIGAAVFAFLWWRRRTPSQATAMQSEINAEEEFKHALAQPDCSHLAMAQQVIPSSAGCYECEQQGTHWNSLRICLLCGHVGCSDDSPQQHALKHSQATGHPLIYEYGNPEGNTIGWCYIDQTYI